MSHRLFFNRRPILASSLLLALAAASTSFAVVREAPTPEPCAADGICRPKRPTWGHYRTQWRTWPGEVVEAEPTPAEEAEEQLEPIPEVELPPPREEDLRGPERSRTAAGAAGAPEGGVQEPPIEREQEIPQPMQDFDPTPDAEFQGAPPRPLPEEPADEEEPESDEPFQNIPDLDTDFPNLSPQGSTTPRPRAEDAPPELPPSLRQALHHLGGYDHLAVEFAQPSGSHPNPSGLEKPRSAMLTVVANGAGPSPSAEPLKPATPEPAEPEVVATNAQMPAPPRVSEGPSSELVIHSVAEEGPAPMRLINPAAAEVEIIDSTEQGESFETIYIEDSGE